MSPTSTSTRSPPSSFAAASRARSAMPASTSATIRSLAVSQRLLGTEEVVLIHHTRCGMLGLSDDDFKRQVREDTGVEPPWPVGGFDDIEESVRRSIELLASSPFLPNKGSIRGFVYDVGTGRLTEVTAE